MPDASADTALQPLLPGLYATPQAALPFVRGGVVRSFLLERPAGNVLIYHAPGLKMAAADILGRGRPERLLVNHWHESMYAPSGLDVPAFVHESDRAQTRLPIAGTFSAAEMIGDDLQIVPTPGHTAGTTCFVWSSGGHRVLFPGDSIWVENDIWKAVLLGESERAAYVASLEQLMALEFDTLAPWGGLAADPITVTVPPAEARARLGEIVARLRAGANA